MNGESDKMVPTKNTVDLDRRLPNSQLVLYPDAGHGGVFQFHEDFVKRAARSQYRTFENQAPRGSW
jgi:pimeloyl-ACP methyl ester carboxylesterase